MRMFCLALLIASFAVPAFAQTQNDLTAEGCAKYKMADEELNKTYYAVRDQYAGDKLFLAKLKDAQKAWLAYRDAHIKELYPAENPQVEYGSMYSMCVCGELEWMTRERIHQLRRWIEGGKEGDACAGSIRVK